ncbi:hypothetical protein KAFR_0D04530 [Kazachstania africana CBS 2517]|uniref:Aspartate/glutamate/uridylate kinase domain-containing protein n=1 Tax=Kazachstania africana (strain ATCC 22294 / BCRC 22015 / CBS 2517 / CECT 1963 / NBRC 1671 / NRRL Y-8276) TaxID=1071382 RepID=H2AUQ1_KAZAF|nr:hypothetical protein KAFR_0D04530 [Kazachstania africana CBS 2517]CCF58101.1 hypothetical protein KAFR_0D04530 [Kazachstania africana CBS 2517]
MDTTKSHTIVIKLGSSSLVDSETHEPRLSIMSKLVETVMSLTRMGHKVVIVSSGGIAMGLNVMNLQERPTSISEIQAIAAIGQGRLIGRWDMIFHEYEMDIAQILLTRNDILDWKQFKNAKNTILELLNMGVVPIVNENDTLSITEIEFGDNDTLSGVTAALIEADYLFLLTDVDCLYTDDPRSDPDAKPIFTIKNLHLESKGLLQNVNVSHGSGSKIGTGGMRTKLIAANLATHAGVNTVVMKSTNPSNIIKVIDYIENCSGEFPEDSTIELDKLQKLDVPLHTKFIAREQEDRLEDRQFWLLHGLVTKGSIIIDKTTYENLLSEEKESSNDFTIAASASSSSSSSSSVSSVGEHLNGLPAQSIIDVEDNFHELDCVNLKVGKRLSNGKLDPNYPLKTVGRVRCNYSSMELNKLKDAKEEKDIVDILGYAKPSETDLFNSHNAHHTDFIDEDSNYIASKENLAFTPI